MPYPAEVPARRGNRLYARTARGCGDNTGITLIARPLRLAGDGERRGGSIALFPELSPGCSAGVLLDFTASSRGIIQENHRLRKGNGTARLNNSHSRK